MKRKFWIALLPLCGCFCVEAGAQSLSALKSELSTPDPSYGSRVEVEEHDGAASAVRSMEGRRAPEKVRGYRVRIYFDNVQHARSQAESVMARFREIYPDIPAYMDYDNIPYFKVTVGNCLTMEEAIILWGRIRDASTGHSSCPRACLSSFSANSRSHGRTAGGAAGYAER